MRVMIRVLLVAALTVAATGSLRLEAQVSSPNAALVPPNPTPDPTTPNLFYGATLPGSSDGPIVVFVHGLHGTASDWWGTNNMYQLAYLARYRTVFVSLNADNSPNDAGIDDNAAMLRSLLPMIASHYNGERFWIVGHSKGGVDTEAALLFPTITPLVKGVFTISTPNQGTELADWAFGPGVAIAGQLNLLTPGVFSLQTARMANFRATADPILQASGIPFYTMTGDLFTGNPITDVTGLILNQLAPSERNDGFVTVDRSKLSPDYATDLGTFHDNHFTTDNGSVSFSRIQSVIGGLESTLAEFQRVAVNGMGDPHNTWIWSMKWYKGALYVGTGREEHCFSLLTSQLSQGTNFYALGALVGDCPSDPNQFLQSLAAEIWKFQPATNQWTRVFKSPSTIPAGQDSNGNPIFVGRDIGFRGMEIYKEADGTEALYVGGVSAGSALSVIPPYSTVGFPPPRILRTTDGANWQAIPQAPGTFMGNIAQPRPGSTRSQWSFRALTSYHGKLFATATDFRGVGMIVASDNPSAGNNAWFQVTDIPENFPVWNITAFNDFLYATTGDQALPNNPGTGLYKTNAAGSPPYQWTPIIVNAGYQLDPRLQSSDGLSFMQFKGQLFLGTNRPTELYRVNPDDTWDLIVGEPRMTPQGVKAPLSGIGIGFGSWFAGHFWRMGNVNDEMLFLSTWDWSVQLRGIADFDHVFDDQYGFDLYRTSDGIHWTAVTRNGMGDPNNYGGRSFEMTPYGLFLGTARPFGGGQVFQCLTPTCDMLPSPFPSPANLQAESVFVAGQTATLSWEVVPGAVKYHVYRATVQPIGFFLGQGASISLQLPGTNQAITLDTINSGQFDSLCAGSASSTLCEGVNVIRDAATNPDGVASFPLPFTEIAVTGDTQYSEPAPTSKQSLYFVTAEDVQGNESNASNFVGAPSKALPSAPPTITAEITPPPNAAGWNNTPVTVTWTIVPSGNDNLISDPCPPVTITADTPGTLLTCTAVTGSGARNLKAALVRIDTVPPTITGTRSPAANANGWNNTDVTVSFTCSDDNSGIIACGPAEQVVSADGAHQFRSAVAVDLAGNKATATVGNINVDKTPPTITGSRTPLANGAGWNNTDVTVSFTCADSLSGVQSCGPAVQVISTEGVNQSRTATVVDMAGNTASATVDGVNIDKTPPTITGAASPLPNGAGWNNSDVTVSYTCGDSLSGVASCTPPQVIATEGTNLSSTGTVTDAAGNSATVTVGGINLDKTPPTITGVASPPPNGAGWNNSDVTVSYTCADSLSGVASCASPQLIATEGTNLSSTGTVTDVAGNSATVTVGGINLDKTPPTITGVASPPANGAGWNNSDVTVSYTCGDSLSGVASCTPPQLIATEGTNLSSTGTVTDVAGNSATVTVGGINLDKTPPIIVGSRAPLANIYGWNNTDVTVSFTCSDALSGVATCGPTVQVVSAEGAGQSRTATVTDVAGNSATATVGSINIDKTPPIITLTQSPVPNSSGWNNTSVTVSFSATDSLSGIATLTSPVTITTEGANQVVAGTAVDKAGNASVISANLNIDLTPPEAIVRFDPATQSTVVIGVDSLSGVPSSTPIPPTLLDSTGLNKGYLITDLAGNTLQAVLTFDNLEGGGQSKAHIQSLQYNGGAVQAVVPNGLNFQSSLLSVGGLNQLNQQLTMQPVNAPALQTSGKFDNKSNKTVVRVFSSPTAPPVQSTIAGLDLLRMVTAAGQISIKF